ncbi:MAG: TolC family protein [Sphingobacteriales bacterium]|nr:MAG: TolC family protein [Sphingobacteriales bacterium]
MNQNTNAKEYQLKAKQLDLQYHQKKADIDFEIDKNTLELNNARRTLAATINNLSLSDKHYQSQLKVFKLGALAYSSLLDTEADLNAAEQNYLKALYSYLVAYYNIKKTFGWPSTFR